jgi:hypothetical protein
MAKIIPPWHERRWEMAVSVREEGLQNFRSANEVSTFAHPELLFQELVSFMSSFKVLLKEVLRV